MVTFTIIVGAAALLITIILLEIELRDAIRIIRRLEIELDAHQRRAHRRISKSINVNQALTGKS